MDISAVARLRKLRKNDEETTISGKEYQNRLQEFYNNKLYQNEFFRWGKQSNNQEYTQEETQFSLPDLINTDYQYFESHKNNGNIYISRDLTRSFEHPKDRKNSLER